MRSRAPRTPFRPAAGLEEGHSLTCRGVLDWLFPVGCPGPYRCWPVPYHAHGTFTPLVFWLPWVEAVRHTLRPSPCYLPAIPEPRRQGLPALPEEPGPVSPRSRVDSKTLTRNTRIIAEALTRVIYNLTEKVGHLMLALSVWSTQPCWTSSHPVPSLYRGRPQTCQCSRSRW